MPKRMLTASFWKSRLVELAIAVILVSGVLHISDRWQRQQRESTPPNAWFVVNELFVPDHVVGEDPLMIYDRAVRQDFTGMWVVEVQREEPGALFSPACLGTGIQHYSHEVVLPEHRVRLSWFVGEDCNLQPGNYRLRATWTIQMPGWPEKKTTETSNIFSVREPFGP